uniref:Helicase like transcription factor n=2 Tax=Callorhinchus milii TaxID=7868 RepID=A0A4W3I5F1_CALMI|eukprot:gi/632968635/ref/XP_007900635.1/ PREDICTED: helicase-like transcription factor isoform X1 [Callorhinchus milii]
MAFWQNWYNAQGGAGAASAHFPDGSFLFAPDQEESLAQFIDSALADSSALAEEALDSAVLLGNLRGNVVGLRYYTGVVSKNEMVALQREPRNAHDSNAIRVNNINGDQVGHLRRQLAAALAFILDNKLARIEGLVPYKVNNKFTMPVQLSFWAPEAQRAAVLSHLQQHGLNLAPPTQDGGGAGVWRARAGPSYRAPSHQPVHMTAEQLKSEFDKIFEDIKEDNKTAEMEPAPAVRTALLPHQKQALAWMVTRENNWELPPFWELRGGLYHNLLTNFTQSQRPDSVHGGILADDMGLGKTLSTIALILSNFHGGRPLPVERSTEEGAEVVDKAPETCSVGDWNMRAGEDLPASARAGAHRDKDLGMTVAGSRPLAVCEAASSSLKSVKPEPAPSTHRSCSARSEWQVTAGKRAPEEMKSGWNKRKKVKSTGSSCKGTGASITALPPTHLGEDTAFAAALGGFPSVSKTQPQKVSGGAQALPEPPARPTLIVCPLSVLSTWMEQFEQHMDPGVQLRRCLYYGPNRPRDPDFLSQQHVVLTTYTTLTTEHGGEGVSPLQAVLWLRVVLDEGHTIRNPNTRQTRAALALKAQRRWLLTGTPIQNSLQDLWSLVSFLKLKPFTERQWWHRTIQRPVSLGDEQGLRRLQGLLRNITLRRTKNSQVRGRPVVTLPRRTLCLQHISLCEEERQIYQAIMDEGRSTISRYLREDSMMTHYADVFAILVRLRQLCCHPHLTARTPPAGATTAADGTPEELRAKLVRKMKMVLSCGVDEECAICLDSLRLPVITHCAHVFCRLCICQVIQQTNARCPMCRAEVRAGQLVECSPGETDSTPAESTRPAWVSSSKVDALMLSLIEIRRQDPNIKSLVVSQFTAFLSLIEIPLRAEGFSFVRFDGSMSRSRRAKTVSSFQSCSPASPTILLLSLRAGGEGLTLTAASRVFLMDPAWNPAAEDQCFDRCHRLGQTRDVIITKFIVKDSVEENMIKIQHRKRDLAIGAFAAKSHSEVTKARVDEIRTLIDL